GRRTFRKRHAKLEEHLLQSRRCNRNQHLGRSGTFVLEGMRRSDRHVGKHPGAGHQAFVANRESDLTVEDVESFFLSAVNVRGWTAPWRNNGFQQGILAVRVLATCWQFVLRPSSPPVPCSFCALSSWLSSLPSHAPRARVLLSPWPSPPAGPQV